MTHQSPHLLYPHWHYFLSFDEDLHAAARYVEPVTDNENVYSIEFARLLISTCSEVEAVLKELCKRYVKSKVCDSRLFTDWFEPVKKKHPGIGEQVVLVSRTGMKITPWSEKHFGDHVPDWWAAYTDIKHDRVAKYVQANQKYVLHAASALYVLVICLYYTDWDKDIIYPKPKFLRIPEDRDPLVARGNKPKLAPVEN